MTGLEQLEQSTSSYFPSTPSQLPVGCLTPGPDGEKVHTSRGSVQSAPSSESLSLAGPPPPPLENREDQKKPTERLDAKIPPSFQVLSLASVPMRF